MGKSIEVGKASKERIEQRQQEWDKGKEEQAGRSAQHIYINVKHTQFFRTRMTPIKHWMGIWGVEHRQGKREKVQDGDLCELGPLYTWHPDAMVLQTAHSHTHTSLYSHMRRERGKKGQLLCPLNFCSQSPWCFVPLSTNCSRNLPPAGSSEPKILNKFP